MIDKPDVVIVGSGIAGALIADRLAHKGIHVQVLEAGKQILRKEVVSRYRNSWHRHPSSAYVRHSHASYPDRYSNDPYLLIKSNSAYWVDYIRLAGGSTWHWTGITPRFLPNDFELYTHYGVGKDWPLSYQEIEPYYLQAEYELGVSGDSEDDHGSPRSGPYPMPPLAMPYSDQIIARYLARHNIKIKVLPAARNSQPYKDRQACCGNNSCTPICPIGAQYSADIHVKSAIKKGAKLIENAVVYNINTDNNGFIESLDYKSPDGISHKIQARYYILACNGIEIPKLLLISRSEKVPNGIANSTGLVGRGLMDHPSGAVSFIMPKPIYAGRGPQIVSTLDHGRDGIFRSQHSAGRFFLLNIYDIQNLATSIIEEEKDWNNIDKRLIYFATHYGYIAINLEQLPDIKNRVKPSDTEVDSIGIPKPEIYMKYDSYIEKAVEYFNSYLDKVIQYLDAKKLSEFNIGKHWPNHPMGTTCMGNNPKSSIVDRYCRAYDHPNLFIAGSSVFPTGGTANPTLTIAALSLRLADCLELILQTEDQ